MERFFGVFVEHYAGVFPVWLAPVQASVIPIADRHNDYAYQVASRLKASGLRIDIDDSSERLGYKIRKAQGQKIPYMLVIGDKEVAANQIAVRKRNGEDLGVWTVEGFNALAQKVIAEKAI